MIKDILNKYMHRVYRSDPYTNVVNGAIGATLDDVHAKTDDWLLQLNVDTATWALAIYEKEHGIITDVKKPLDERRSVIKSKMRGTGKIGAIQIKIVADAWSNGDVDVSLSPSGGTVIIQFTNVYGIPSNIPDLQAAVREIVPAHLAIEYQYKYYTYGEMKATGLTYEQIAATGLTYEQILTGGLRNGNNN